MESHHHSGIKVIETAELQSLLESHTHNVKLVCATWNMGGDNPNPVEQFEKAHLKGSVYFNIQEIADKSSGFLATLPNKEDFIREMKRLGIKRTDTIVVYEHDKIFAGPRAAWMLRIYGAHDVRILNGCLKKWISEDRKTEEGKPEDVNDESDEGYDYQKDEHMYDTYKSTMKKVYAAQSKSKVSSQIYQFLNTSYIEEGNTDYEFIDSRGSSSFAKGHPIGFKNSPYEKYLDEDQSSFKNKEDLQRIFEEENIDTGKSIVFSCGGGVTACIGETAAVLVGAKHTSIFDGSFQEYSKLGEPDFSNPDWEEQIAS